MLASGGRREPIFLSVRIFVEHRISGLALTEIKLVTQSEMNNEKQCGIRYNLAFVFMASFLLYCFADKWLKEQTNRYPLNWLRNLDNNKKIV
ncbi:hypothetical protein BpHYR1_004202 [Brachionus plicatilis]|uniref:Uncharacterized protein n=1 Tax=Brachionus plicatilis TaxID=10195 RepID=A0A3M7R1B2_BRAPC|nr:hypothetical protein BpHYR1_004202 [Brachionus plicatilis]